MEKQMQVVNGVPMMGSRAIAEVTGKNHDHVKRDILAMLAQLGFHSPDLENDDFKGFFINRKEYQARNVIDEIFLNENLSMTLVTGYDAVRRLALIEQWQDMKKELSQPHIAAQPAQQAISPTPDILSVARVVAEATASATMKAVMDVVNINQVATPAVPAPVIAAQPDTAAAEGEFVRVVKVAWETTLSDGSCRRLIKFSSLPTQKYKGSRGLLVHRGAFMQALAALIDESTPPTEGRKRWQHPEFGGFELHKDLNEILGEGYRGE
ncbi:Rha family transcriptional regulator [Klebsiella michiganensis]|uniref:Rha family transcriptional regulator n=1 Tax=Klebsiella michiganensis TaxID=1134687 RepID=UPI003D31370E